MSIGKLLHIHTTAAAGRPMVSHQSAIAIADAGLEGDRYLAGTGRFSRSPDPRDVTLFENEVLQALKEERGFDLRPLDHRRNLTTEGVALMQLVGKTFSVGGVTLEGLRPCNTCRFLNVAARKPVSVPLADRAGLICRVVTGGAINVSDPVTMN
ncbi:MOSC domain-containing protein [Tropicibacter sp. Alg240-R139]|uniref:MOSC domain-containing protein n=1 Tax=Tropicibacter sp. Alg240-R139 TaxID=2305991 RepID=UPI0013DECFB3|nr:MOSC domain-containing protein [Tropicibacter sp. Alg240-R139]